MPYRQHHYVTHCIGAVIITLKNTVYCQIVYQQLPLQSTSLEQYTPCFRKKTSTHIIGYKLRNSCLILIIFDNKTPHII